MNATSAAAMAAKRNAQQASAAAKQPPNFIGFIADHIINNAFAYVYIIEQHRDAVQTVGVCVIYQKAFSCQCAEFDSDSLGFGLRSILDAIVARASQLCFKLPMQIFFLQRETSNLMGFLRSNPDVQQFCTMITSSDYKAVMQEIQCFYDRMSPEIICDKCRQWTMRHFVDSVNSTLAQEAQGLCFQTKSNSLSNVWDSLNQRPFYLLKPPCAQLSAFLLARMVDKMIFTWDFFYPLRNAEKFSYFNPVYFARQLLNDSEFFDLRTYCSIPASMISKTSNEYHTRGFMLIKSDDNSLDSQVLGIINEFFEIVDISRLLAQFNFLKDAFNAIMLLLNRHEKQFLSIIDRIFPRPVFLPMATEDIKLNYRLAVCVQLAALMHGVAHHIATHSNVRQIAEHLRTATQAEVEDQFCENTVYQPPIEESDDVTIAGTEEFLQDVMKQQLEQVVNQDELQDQRNRKAYYDSVYSRLEEPYQQRNVPAIYGLSFIDSTECQRFDIRQQIMGMPVSELATK